MQLQPIFEHYRERFFQRYGQQLNKDQWSALNAVLGCRTEQYGEVHYRCDTCQWQGQRFQSCGHRFCHRCQNTLSDVWLDRQEQKQLPVEYFMVTFTLPKELRGLFKTQSVVCYNHLFRAAKETLGQFAQSDRALNGSLGFTAVLHTHSRQLHYHPHIHCVVPAGAFNTKRQEWRAKEGKYLFRQGNLAKVFRAILLKNLQRRFHTLPATPKEWMVDCEHVGSGLPALTYLAKYLYRGVISPQQIIKDDGEEVTFQYQDSATKAWQRKTLKGEHFIYVLLQHVLPKGFRRVRDFGFLHGNAKRTLKRIQLYLKIKLSIPKPKEKRQFPCERCQRPTRITHIISAAHYRKLHPS